MPKYQEEYDAAKNDKGAFFSKMAEDVSWHKKFTKAIDESNAPLYKWFPDGEINICYNALDRHIANGDGERVAFYYDCVYLDKKKAYTYNEVHNNVGRLASVLKKKYGLVKGDRALIYMPMMPEAAFAMLACARLGVIHSVVFGGFAAKEVTNRIEDC